MKRRAFTGRTRQAGTVAVEFALVAIIFFTIVFATLELARMEFLLNTLEEVTRRAASAAANVDYRDAAAMQNVQADAVFRTSSGPLALGTPVTSDNVKIDYLSVSKATWDLNHMSSLPACPAGNRLNCMTDPNAGNCIRFVRARVCASTTRPRHPGSRVSSMTSSFASGRRSMRSVPSARRGVGSGFFRRETASHVTTAIAVTNSGHLCSGLSPSSGTRTVSSLGSYHGAFGT